MFYVKTKRPSKQICELAKGNKLIRFKIIGGDLLIDDKSYIAVSYTHLTLPTNREV